MLHVLDARALRRWYECGLAALEASRDEINSLNVFPVPDGDTGTNLHLTLRSAALPGADEPARLPSPHRLAGTAEEIARRCLRGAHGSSGVILSQLIRGVAEALADAGLRPRGRALAVALERAATLAYTAVSRPVEGTMLTVVRVAAAAARDTGSDDLATVVDAAAAAARRALAETPQQLDVLARAGVVDAGGRGVVALLDALQAVVHEGVAQRAAVLGAPTGRPPIGAAAEGVAGYEVMYLLDAADDDIPGLRTRLDLLDRGGDSVVVSGGGGLWHVHVHTDDAGAAVELGAGVGRPHRVKVTPLPPALPAAFEHPPALPVTLEYAPDAAQHAVVVLAKPGSPLDALRAVFERNGAWVVTSTDALSDVAARLGIEQLVLLTDAAAATSGLRPQLRERGLAVEVLAATSPVQLVAALAVHDPQRPFDADVLAMCTAVAVTRHGAVRPDGDGVLGEFDAVPPMRGEDAAEVAVALLDRMMADGAELATVVAEPNCGARIEALLDGQHRGVEIVRLAADVGRHVWLGVE